MFTAQDLQDLGLTWSSRPGKSGRTGCCEHTVIQIGKPWLVRPKNERHVDEYLDAYLDIDSGDLGNYCPQVIVIMC
jgi:hypothetical protein